MGFAKWRYDSAKLSSPVHISDLVCVSQEEFSQKHIRGAVNTPSSRFMDDKDVDEIIASVPHGTAVIAVHCHLSQVRGPKCAARSVQGNPI